MIDSTEYVKHIISRRALGTNITNVDIDLLLDGVGTLLKEVEQLKGEKQQLIDRISNMDNPV